MSYLLLSVLSSVVYASCLQADIHNGTALNGYHGIKKRQPMKIVNLDVYYESLCPDSIRLYTKELVFVMKQLGAYINLRTIPYGKATTYVQNGMITFKCQHGERECYGNKLHACAIEQLPFWLDFNACLLAELSDDDAVDQCAAKLNTNALPIKTCAKSDKGSHLLKYYGEESGKVSYSFIPHVRIDGVPMRDGANLMAAVNNAINNAQ